MKNKIVQNKIEELVYNKKSNWLDKAEWRKDNQDWLDKSARIALKVLRTIRSKNISQLELAKLVSVSPQQISKILKGQENLTLETITKLEVALGIELIAIPKYSSLLEISVAPFNTFVPQPRDEKTLRVTEKSKWLDPWFKSPCVVYSLSEEYQRTGTDD